MNSARTRFWIAFVLSAAVWLFALFDGGRASAWDASVAAWFKSASVPFLTRNAAVFSVIGEPYVLLPIALIAAIFLIFHRKRRAGLFLIMVIGGRFLVELQKLLVDRPRPHLTHSNYLAVNSYSFPSGHAANSMMTLLAIALLLPVRQRYRAIAVGVALALTLQIGVSRIILERHWPSDVLGGWAFGLLWVVACLHLASARPDAEPNHHER